LLDRAAALRAKLFGKASDQLADVLVEQASALSVARFYSESEKLFLQAIAMKQLVARDGPDLAEAYRKLAESLVQQKRYGEAEIQAKASLAAGEEYLGKELVDDDPLLIPALNTLMLVYEAEGKIGEVGRLGERLTRGARAGNGSRCRRS